MWPLDCLTLKAWFISTFQVREHGTLDGSGPGRSRRSAQCGHQRARGQPGLDFQLAGQPSFCLLSERIIGNFVRGMGKGTVFPLEFCYSGPLAHPLLPSHLWQSLLWSLLLAGLGVSSAEAILKLEVFMRPSCMSRRPPA